MSLEKIVKSGFDLSFLKNLNPFQSTTSTIVSTVVLGGSIVTAGFVHVLLSRRRLRQLKEKMERLHKNSSDELQASIVFEPLDKLYLIRNLEYPDLMLDQHQAIRNKIATAQASINKFLGVGEQFSRLFKWVSYKWFNQQLQSIDRLRDATSNVLNYAGHLNSALLYFKQRLYDLAAISVKEALKIRENRSIAFSDSSWEHLCAHTCNLAAKIARCQKQYKASDAFYETALHYSPQDIHIACSQIALWGDSAWDQRGDTKIDLNSIKKFLQDQEKNEELVKYCQTKKYGLGLANLSWFYIQAAKNIEKLGLENKFRQIFLEKALGFAEDAVAMEEHAPSADRSINAWLFLGIAKMDLGDNKNKELLEEALVVFEAALEIEKDHPSLLRRKALALYFLGKDARDAYQDLLVELQYRLDLGDIQNNYKDWLKEAKERITGVDDAKGSKEKKETKKGLEVKKTKNVLAMGALEAQEKIYHCLVQKQYQKAYDVVSQLSPEIGATDDKIIRLNAWFVRHFSISKQGKLSPKLRQRLLLNLEIDNLPAPDLFMKLSIAVYYAKHNQPLGLPQDWVQICTSQKVFPEAENEGYLAVAFQHTQSQQIIIAHGGTDVSDWHDLRADVQLTLGSQHAQLPLAEKFTRHVVQNYAASVTHDRCYMIYHTGHSLGGAIAAHMASASGSIKMSNGKNWTQYAVTFDNPSCWWQLDSQSDELLKNQLLQEHYSDFPITAYLTRPTFINCAGGPHLGRIMKLSVHPDKAKLPQEIIQQEMITFLRNKTIESLRSYTTQYGITSPELVKNFQKGIEVWEPRIKNNVACHGKELIGAAFAMALPQIYQEPQRIYYATAWPRDLEKWLEFERSMTDLGKDPLTYVPESKEEKAMGYSLQPLASEAGELIPLNALESGLRSFFLEILPYSDDTKSINALTEKHRLFRAYLSRDFFDWIILSADKKNLEIIGPLSAWEILGYIRGRINKACQEKNSSYNEFMYPLLSSCFHPIIKVESTALGSLPQQPYADRLADESMPLLASEGKGDSKRLMPTASAASAKTSSSLSLLPPASDIVIPVAASGARSDNGSAASYGTFFAGPSLDSASSSVSLNGSVSSAASGSRLEVKKRTDAEVRSFS